jgi:hypothetical protein
VHSGASRWQEVLTDQQRALRRAVARDLSNRVRSLREAAREKIAAGDPLADWSELEPWLHRELNRRLAAHHRDLLHRVEEVASTAAAQFGVDISELPFDLSLGQSLEPGRHVERPKDQRASLVDVVVAAARGFSVSSTVTGVLLIAVSAPVALVSVPLTATLGTVLAVHSVRTLRKAQLRTAQQAAERAVLAFLAEEEHHSSRLDDELLDTAYVSLRNGMMDLSEQLRTSARAAVAAVASAADDDGDTEARSAGLRAQREELATLHAFVDRVLHGRDSVMRPGESFHDV